MKDARDALIRAAMAWYQAEDKFGNVDAQPRLAKNLFIECYVYEAHLQELARTMRERLKVKT